MNNDDCDGECRRTDTEPAPALEEESETMTPKELLDLAAVLGYPYKRRLPELEKAAAALRSYAELVGAMLYLKRGRSPYVYVQRAKERGWPGLEEL